MHKRPARIPRFHVSVPLHCDSELQLDKQSSHHLVTVLRAKRNDSLSLFNGDGHDYSATLLDTGQRAPGKKALLQIHGSVMILNESPLDISLVQCISRADRMDITLRQTVELGVTHIQPVFSRHTGKTPDPQRQEKRNAHWQSIIISACEQCGRAIVPSLAPATDLASWISGKANRAADTVTLAEKASLSFILSPTASLSLHQHVRQLKAVPDSDPSTICLLAGPESGFDAEEIRLALANNLLEAHLGPRVLRTETSGAAALAVLQTLLGDL